MKSTGPALRVRDLTKVFDKTVALDGADLTIAKGEIVALLGPSGCGKTTLLMSVAGFTRPDTGTIEVMAKDIARLPPNKRDIGFVFQSYALFPHMSVWDNVAFPLKRRGAARADLTKKVGATLSLVRLEHLKNRYPGALSGGQKQRVALARALVFDPPLLLLDEPLSALDKNLREEMQEELVRIQRSLGTTMLFVTHDQHEAMAVSDRIAVMQDGAIAQFGAPKDVYDRPCSEFVGRFLGDANLIERDRLHWPKVESTGSASAPIVGGSGGGLVLVRPEHVKLCRIDGREMLSGRVIAKEFRGAITRLIVDVPNVGPVTSIILSDQDAPEPGDDVGLTWRGETASVLRPRPEKGAVA